MAVDPRELEERQAMSPRAASRRPEAATSAGDRTGAARPGSEEPGERSRSSRVYHPPRLVVYGRLTDVTRFGGSQIVDSGGNLGNLQ